ncbi:MAG: glycyl-radical enzyme activating protein [Lachnospiraceae bacterium]|nr:glycyl-radical enzyme activating protein [Lachnospiraceae bacterium]
MKGTIFDIKQLAVFDGPGIRTTVFLKGCPLRCMWCHNPEGLISRPQLMRSTNGCMQCGRCQELLKHPAKAVEHPELLRVCPKNLFHISGQQLTVEELVAQLRLDEEYLKLVGGGITFSGGEPLAQADFLEACLKELSDMNLCIETSGYAMREDFEKIVELLDFVVMDLKMIDDVKHRYYTGVSNKRILSNLEYLKASGKPFVIRVPLIPGVNDTVENMVATAKLLQGTTNLQRVELLPYHRTAGVKYKMLGNVYAPRFDENREVRIDTEVFEKRGVTCRSL